MGGEGYRERGKQRHGDGKRVRKVKVRRTVSTSKDMHECPSRSESNLSFETIFRKRNTDFPNRSPENGPGNGPANDAQSEVTQQGCERNSFYIRREFSIQEAFLRVGRLPS